MTFQKVLYGHLTPGRPCLLPERLIRGPAFNVGRPFPHLDRLWNP
jgi:hypothetical protein